MAHHEVVTVILVEGESDRAALEVVVARLGAELPRILAVGGSLGVGRAVAELPGERLLGLVDAAERSHFEAYLAEVFVCDPDLESELIQALGVAGVEAVLESEHELESFRLLQRQPGLRESTPEHQLLRFIGGRSGNKLRFARLLARAVPLEKVPAPLAALISAVR